MKDTEQSATVEGTLRSAGVRVLVVGSGEYPPESALPAIPAVASTVSTLAATLTSRCGVPITHLKTLSDPVGPAEFGEALATIAAEADDVFVLYFVGHGLVSPGGELYLATAATRDPTAPTLGLSALAYSTLRDILRTACRARSVVIVLDCCFSGRAHRSVTAAAADGFELAATGGGYVLTSAAADEAALAPPGRPLTAFSEALCKLLTDGNPVGRPWISLEDAFLYLRRELPARGIPAPRRSQNGVVGRLVLAANPAAAPVLSLEPPAPHPEPGDSELPCPYLGLAPYTGDDARYFFGRKDTVDKVLDRIALHIDDGPLILIGVSGVGKSSLASIFRRAFGPA